MGEAIDQSITRDRRTSRRRMRSSKMNRKLNNNNIREIFEYHKLSNHIKYLSLFISASSTSFILQVLSETISQDSILAPKHNNLLGRIDSQNNTLIQMNPDDTQFGNNNSGNLFNSNLTQVLAVNGSSKEIVMLNQQNFINGSSFSNFTPQPPPEESMKFPLYMRILATFACLLIFIVGVCGNLLVPIVVIKTKYLRNSTNLFLINLAVADLLVLIICEPTVLIELHSRPETWLLGESMCKISNFVEMTAANASIFTILAISFERYYAICKPLKAGYKCTRLRATIIICLIWLLSLVLTSPILIMAKSLETIYIDGSLVNNCILETDTYWHKMYVFVSMFAFFCLPLIVLMLVYWLISRRLIRENVAMSTTTSLATNESASHLEGTSCQNQHHHFKNDSCSCNEDGLKNKGNKTRSQSLRKAASFKHSVSNFLTSRYNQAFNNNNNNNNNNNQHLRHNHHQNSQTNQIATQTDLIVVDVSSQNGQRSNISHLKRPPKLIAEKSHSLDHHLMAKVGSNQLLVGENNHYHENGHQACNASRLAHQICFCRDSIKQQNDKAKKAACHDGNHQRQQMNIIEIIKSSSSINSEWLHKFLYRLFGLKLQNAQCDSGATDELAHSTSCDYNTNREKDHADGCNKLTSGNSKLSMGGEFDQHTKAPQPIEANEFLMESICEEFQAIDCDEFGIKKDRVADENNMSNHNNYCSNGSDQNHDQKVPFLSPLNHVAANQNPIGISNNLAAGSCNYTKTLILDDNDNEQQQRNVKKRTLGNTAKNLLNGAKGTFRFNWSRQTSISSSISISTSTQTNSTNLPSESSVAPLSRCNSFNNPQQPRLILNSDCSGSNAATSAAGCCSNLAAQIESNSFTPEQISIGAPNESDEQQNQQNSHMKRKNRHKLYQRKCAHFESSLSSNTALDSNTALMVNYTDESRTNNRDQITRTNSTSSSAHISSSSPYSSKSSSPDSLLEHNRQQNSTRLELSNKQRSNTTNNSASSASYKDLLEDSLLEADENPSSTLNEQQQSVNVDNLNCQVIYESGQSGEFESSITAAPDGEKHLLVATRNKASTGPLASPDFEKLANIAAPFQTIPERDIDRNNHLLNGNDKHNFKINDKHEISSEKNNVATHADKNIGSSIVKDNYKVSEKSRAIILRNRNRNKSLDLNHRHSSVTNVQDSMSRCCSVHNQTNQSHGQGQGQGQNHFHFSFTKRPYWCKRRSNPVICNHLRQNKTHLNELLVVQDLSKKQQMDSRRQVVIMLAFVVAAFFLLFFPYRVFTIWLILSTEDQVQSLGMETYYNLTYFSRILIYLHSAINPIAYNLISTKFRRAFMSILLCHGSSDRRYFTTEHNRIINRNVNPRNNSMSDQKKSSLPDRISHQIRLPR